MSEGKKEKKGETNKLKNIKDIKHDNELKDELKEWEVESTHEAG